MEFIIPSSLAGIIVACLLGLFVAIQMIIDGFQIGMTRRLAKQLIQIGKAHSQKSFTVVISLNKKAAAILPLLKHLYGLDDKRVQVLIVLKHTAGKNAQANLVALRRQYKWQDLRIVSYKKGQSTHDLVRRYGKGDLVIELLPDSRLSPNFFDDISYELLLNPQAAIIPTQQHQLDASLTSAFAAHFELWGSLYALVVKKVQHIQPNLPLVVYANRLAAVDTPVIATTAHAAILTCPARQLSSRQLATALIGVVTRHTSLLKIVATIIVVATICVVLFQILEQGDFVILASTVLAAYVVIYNINMLRQRGHSVVDKVSLFLLSPFAMIYGMLLIVCAAALYVLRPIFVRRSLHAR